MKVMMIKLWQIISTVALILLMSKSLFANPIVNVYVWGGEIPDKIIQQFEDETGIKVNFSTYDSNETMYAKLHASNQTIYDVILPSAYVVEHMQKKGLLTKLDHTQLPYLSNIDPMFTHNAYDNDNHYSVPFIWGATGIFYNQKWIKHPPTIWQALWEKRWRKQLMLLDDSREIFAIALMSLGFPPNDSDPGHIHIAYQKLLTLIPNIKLFSSEGIQAVMIDGDALAGLAWNGDAFKAHEENDLINFIYPEEGFVIWVDCLAIPINAPHLKEAYQFINYLLKPQIAAQVALEEGHAIANAAGKNLLPNKIRNNLTVYPPPEVLKHGHFQRDVGEETIALYNKYWEELKLAF